MKTIILLTMVTILAMTNVANAVDLSGTWQGTIKYQHVLKLTKKPGGGYHGEWFNLGQEQEGTLNGGPISSVDFDGSHVKFTPDRQAQYYQGDLSADGKTFTGTWGRQGPFRKQLDLVRATKKTAWIIDPSPHKIHFVTVDKGVKLEVLDWGGNGTPLVFLAGLGNTAHVFDTFAPKFTRNHHVYAITRRGFGTSSAPPYSDTASYDADRLGDDVLAVLAALKVSRPTLAGHSIAGEELSSIGTRHPASVAGLVYLDAAYEYALYNPASSSLTADSSIIRRELTQVGELPVRDARAMLTALLETQLPRLQKELQDFRQMIATAADTEGPQGPPSEVDRTETAISFGFRQYSKMEAPALVLIAVPPNTKRDDTSASAKADLEEDAAQSAAMKAGMPNAKLVKLNNANHYIFRSNEAEVEQQMNAFIGGLH
jgi:non-heme chloroperoxidase